ncbi:MAG: hypothetical protein O3B01_02650 [Planctomycetota bacterium]|nr:hypothetical protein [Planctomycetota bacterium]MDA1137458.1 hypothetical protein [Planctomycetota bacterium]
MKCNLALFLTCTFILAMVMGPGPGLLLINPDISQPNPELTIGGFPKLYAWGIFWYVIQIAVVVTAYFLVWKDDEPETEVEIGPSARETDHD